MAGKQYMGINGKTYHDDGRQEFEGLRVGDVVTAQEKVRPVDFPDDVVLEMPGEWKFVFAATRTTIVGFTDMEMVIMQIDNGFSVVTSIDNFHIAGLYSVIGHDDSMTEESVPEAQYYCHGCGAPLSREQEVCSGCGTVLPKEKPEIQWRFNMLEVEE